MSVTQKQRWFLDALVREVPRRLDSLFIPITAPDSERGACTTYSRILSEVLGEVGIWAEVRPVALVTANRVAIDLMTGKISQDEAVRRGGRVQMWGDIKEGQRYQHAVCFIPQWDVVTDLAMSRRGSGLVPCYPYWAEGKNFPWWLVLFEYKTYRLEYRAYETQPDEVRRAKDIIRDLARKNL